MRSENQGITLKGYDFFQVLCLNWNTIFASQWFEQEMVSSLVFLGLVVLKSNSKVSNPKVYFLVWKRETRQIRTQARYIRTIIIFLIYRHCLFPWTIIVVGFKPVVPFIFIFVKARR